MYEEYFQDITEAIERGQSLYVCSEVRNRAMSVTGDLSCLRAKARHIAMATGKPVSIYRLVVPDENYADAYLFVRKIIEGGPPGQPNPLWALADTRQAAELLRDVSAGPSPCFGAILEEICHPDGSGPRVT